jgi:hypothetical protein
MYVGKIPKYVFYINTATYFCSERHIFEKTHQLDREAYVTIY